MELRCHGSAAMEVKLGVQQPCAAMAALHGNETNRNDIFYAKNKRFCFGCVFRKCIFLEGRSKELPKWGVWGVWGGRVGIYIYIYIYIYIHM